MNTMRVRRLLAPTKMVAMVAMVAMGWTSVAHGWTGPTAATAPAQSPPSSAPIAISVSVTNPLAAARAKETVAITRAQVIQLFPTADFKSLVVADGAGKPLLSQLVDMDGDDEPDEIVFQADLGSSQTKTFKLRTGTRTPAVRGDFRAYGRFVRERFDDFAWENDVVAHRVYGPALETAAKEPLISSGVDAWSKRTPRLVINDWYMTGDYHRDLGEGADFYGVGKSRGCGGLGLWANGKLAVSRNFVISRVLAQGPIRLVFELHYAPWEVVPGVRVGETKRVVLDAGSHWNRIESTFTGTVPGKLSAGVGIAKHPGGTMAVDAGSASLRVWEPLKGLKGEPSGNFGCAVVLSAGAPLEEHHGDLDYLVVTPVPAGGKLGYYMGTAWDKGSKIRDAAAWEREVKALAARAAAPVKVSLSPAK
jgi:unsaturated rhamnogalacturonyl hydrolase